MCSFCRSDLKHEAESHKLKHANIVQLYAMVFEPDHYGVVLEYVPHGDLDEFISKNKVRNSLYEMYNTLKQWWVVDILNHDNIFK